MFDGVFTVRDGQGACNPFTLKLSHSKLVRMAGETGGRGGAQRMPGGGRRRGAVLCVCAMAAAALVGSVVDGSGRRTVRAAGAVRPALAQQALWQSGKAAEQEEAKRLDNLRDPAVGRAKSGAEVERAGVPLRPGGLGVWLGRGEVPDRNAWDLNYLDTTTNAHYGQTAVTHHAWSPLPDANTPNSQYYNVLDHWKAPDPMAPAAATGR